jgi:hypothetical protein
MRRWLTLDNLIAALMVLMIIALLITLLVVLGLGAWALIVELDQSPAQ